MGMFFVSLIPYAFFFWAVRVPTFMTFLAFSVVGAATACLMTFYDRKMMEENRIAIADFIAMPYMFTYCIVSFVLSVVICEITLEGAFHRWVRISLTIVFTSALLMLFMFLLRDYTGIFRTGVRGVPLIH